MKDPLEKKIQQILSKVGFRTKKDRKYFEKSEKEKMKPWSQVHDIPNDAAISSLEGTF